MKKGSKFAAFFLGSVYVPSAFLALPFRIMPLGVGGRMCLGVMGRALGFLPKSEVSTFMRKLLEKEKQNKVVSYIAVMRPLFKGGAIFYA